MCGGGANQRLAEDRGINFPDSIDNDALGEMVRTIERARKTLGFSNAVIDALQALRGLLVKRQRA
jgi:hypothetical protein